MPIDKTDTFKKILAMPVTKPAIKRWAILNAYRYNELLDWQIDELRRQWEFTTPHVSFPEKQDTKYIKE